MSSSFVDKARITIIAGNGGDGAVAFHREKYIASGGPDGGDGGKGGNVVFRVDDNMSTLMDFKIKRKYVAGNGLPGQGKRCYGKDGETLYLKVPRGTVIRDTQTGLVMHDMSSGEDWIAAKGGRGGWGNTHFATPTRQTPRFAKPGLPGESHDITLELKLLADVGLVGYPNVGKSSFLSVVSKAHPKIANYHFTTLFPNLGVVYVGEGASFVLADIPGIIDGASEGKGLGHDFLRHIERCRLLVHIVDGSGSEGRDCLEDFISINNELQEYNPELATRPQIVVANKCDLIGDDREGLDKLKEYAISQGLKYFEISTATHSGIDYVIKECWQQLSVLPLISPLAAEYIQSDPVPDSVENITITRIDDIWVVEGSWLEKMVSRTNFSDYESRMHFDKVLRDSGVFDRMEESGVKDGDTVNIYDLIFEYKD